MALPSTPETERRPGHDPVTFSVILNRFYAIVNEMTITLERTAWSSVLNMARDYSCAVYDAAGRQIAIFEGIPIHTTSMHLVLEEIARTFGEDIHDGDVFACNDPFRRNTHVGDLVTARPVFVAGRHLFWSVTKGHQLDTGAYVPASCVSSAENIWQEGIQMPPIKLYDRGVPRADVIDFYLANVRYREQLRGDLLAQCGSIAKGTQRLVEMCDEFGADEVTRYLDAIIDYADRRMAAEIAAIPDGEYRGEGWIDTDGAGGLHVPIKVRVVVSGDRISADYTGSGAQVPSGLNGTEATSLAAGSIPFLCFIDPDIPHNHGCISHISVFAPEGTICNARYPASTSCATVVPSDMMQDVINKAMAAVIPDRVPAGGPRAGAPAFSGLVAHNGEPWAVYLFNSGGGSGAAKDCDGWPIIGAKAASGGLKSLSIEQIELLYPMVIEAMTIERDSMGFGTWIGGPGTRMVVKPLEDGMHCVGFGDGWLNPPHGVVGGTPGIGGGQFVDRRASGRKSFFTASGTMRLTLDDAWVGVSTGGGGYGNPLERDAEAVARDVRDGIISRAVAADVFGVIVGEGLEPEVDRQATAAARRRLGEEPRPLIQPTVPGAATWVAENMADRDEFLIDPT